MSTKAFLDTNILIYACDQDEPKKRKAARHLIRSQSKENSLGISTQVLQEFFVAATKKLRMEPLKVKDIIYSLNHLEIDRVDLSEIQKAIDGSILWQISFWDALIIVSAQKLHCDILYTEDLNPGQEFDSLKIANPFSI